MANCYFHPGLDLDDKLGLGRRFEVSTFRAKYCYQTLTNITVHLRDQVICEVDVIHILTKVIQNILIEHTSIYIHQYIYSRLTVHIANTNTDTDNDG